MRDFRVHDFNTQVWQVTIQPSDGPRYTTNIFASTLHEARILAPLTSTRPHTDPGRVIDVCLYEIVKARADAVQHIAVSK